MKAAVDVPGATITDAGTVTEALLLTKLTLRPPLSVAAFSVSVQLSDPAPVINELVQLSALSAGTPLPLRLTDAEDPVVALLVIINWPFAAPDAAGLNWTAKVKLLLPLMVTGSVLWLLVEKD